jgi:outer membrane receptor protein involved in Fe transport
MNYRFATMTLIGCTATALAVAAEENSAAAPEALQEVVVTGSTIPTAPDEVAVPVVSLGSAELAQVGVDTNALEILRKAIPSFAGRSNAGNTNANNNNQNTAGGSQVQLRNLPTLILVNGRRVANSGIGGINGKNFVDVNQIPAAAIDHIDVLTDGASSIYGSDAVGGVVNFILKSGYEGLTAGVRVGSGADYGERSAFVTGGAKFGGASVTATASFVHSDPLYQYQRAITSPLYGKTSSIPGVVAGGSDLLAPALSSPSQKNPTGINATAASIVALVANGTYQPSTSTSISNGFDVSPYQNLLMKQNMASFIANMNLPLGDSVTLFGDVMLSQGKSATRWLPVAMTGITVPAAAPYNPLTTAFAGVTFSYLPDPHGFYNTVQAARVTAGLRGEITRDWTWETGVVYSESDLTQLQTNLIYKPNVARAIAGGFDQAGNAVSGGAYSQLLGGYSLTGPLALQPALDPFATAAGVNGASLANLYGTETINAISQLASWDGQLVGRVLNLPAGSLGVAVGANLRRETLSGHTDPNARVTDPVTGSTTGNDQQWLGGTYADPFTKSRTIDGLFVEVRVPLTSNDWSVPGFRALDLTGAVRAEHYSDAGRSTVPKIGFRWQPIDAQFTVRGNYAKSFVAPTLYSEYGPTDTRQVGAAVISGAFGNAYGNMPFNGEDGNNPNLQPATSISKTVGFVFKPHFLPHFSLTADFSDITLQGFQGGLGFNNILLSINALGSASPYFNNLGVDNFPGMPGASQPFTQPGALLAFLTSPAQANRLYLIDQFRNLTTLIEQSWNITADYAVPTAAAGTFDLSTTGAIFNSFRFQALPGQSYIEYAGHTTNSGVFGGTLPRYRFYTTLGWTYRDFDMEISNTFISATTDTGPNGTSAPLPVSRYFSWDARVGYDWRGGTIKDLKLSLGVNNVTDRMPPLAPRTFTDNNADISTYSPIGRLLYGSVSVSL